MTDRRRVAPRSPRRVLEAVGVRIALVGGTGSFGVALARRLRRSWVTTS